jgi:hypothetical protein
MNVFYVKLLSNVHKGHGFPLIWLCNIEYLMRGIRISKPGVLVCFWNNYNVSALSLFTMTSLGNLVYYDASCSTRASTMNNLFLSCCLFTYTTNKYEYIHIALRQGKLFELRKLIILHLAHCKLLFTPLYFTDIFLPESKPKPKLWHPTLHFSYRYVTTIILLLLPLASLPTLNVTNKMTMTLSVWQRSNWFHVAAL